jgi:hypothetical protein
MNLNNCAVAAEQHHGHATATANYAMAKTNNYAMAAAERVKLKRRSSTAPWEIATGSPRRRRSSPRRRCIRKGSTGSTGSSSSCSSSTGSSNITSTNGTNTASNSLWGNNDDIGKSSNSSDDNDSDSSDIFNNGLNISSNNISTNGKETEEVRTTRNDTILSNTFKDILSYTEGKCYSVDLNNVIWQKTKLKRGGGNGANNITWKKLEGESESDIELRNFLYQSQRNQKKQMEQEAVVKRQQQEEELKGLQKEAGRKNMQNIFKKLSSPNLAENDAIVGNKGKGKGKGKSSKKQQKKKASVKTPVATETDFENEMRDQKYVAATIRQTLNG